MEKNQKIKHFLDNDFPNLWLISIVHLFCSLSIHSNLHCIFVYMKVQITVEPQKQKYMYSTGNC